MWNSGIFVWKAATLLELLARYQPEIAAGLEAIKRAAAGKSLANPSPKLRAVIAREYKKMPSLSIDYAVMEKAGSEGKVLTLEADFGWSDVGSWAAVHRMMRKDAHGNASKDAGWDSARRTVSFMRRIGWSCFSASKTPSSSTRRTLCWSAISSAPRKCAIWSTSCNRQGLRLVTRFKRVLIVDSSNHLNSRLPQGPFQADDAVVLLDRKDREYLARLDQRRAIAIRGGKIAVDDIIGRDEGSVVRSSMNEPFLVFRPSLAATDSQSAAQRPSDLSQRHRARSCSGRISFPARAWSKPASAPAP